MTLLPLRAEHGSPQEAQLFGIAWKQKSNLKKDLFHKETMKMKHMKRFMALFAALALVLAMAAPAFADEPTTGSITINNAIKDTTYTAYKIFDLDYVEATTTTKASYAYKADANWKAFVTSPGAGAAYVDYNEKTRAVTAKDEFTKEQAPAFAKAALAYARDNGITGVTETADASGKVEFKNLDLGYYVVDTPMGALCVLDSTIPNVNVNEKNEVPSVEKKVKAGSDYAASNTAKIGETVEFETKINVKKGAANYVLHDKMDAGLTLDKTSIKVVVDDAVVTANETTTYAVKTEQGDKKDSDCTFEIVFADTYVAGLAGKTIVVTYNATLNSKAVVGGTGNNNETYLKYGNDNNTTHGKTTTYTYEFDVVKTNDADQLLEGAVFSLYESEDAPTPMNLVAVGTGVYRLPTTGETASVTQFTAGKVTIQGLANGNYYLEEITAPKGYNKLDHRERITIDNADLKATTTENTYTNGGVKVVNKAGTVLPGTGGIGTTVFYLIGGGLMVAAAVLLIAKKRMENK